MSKLYKSGLNKRERNHGLTDKQLNYIFQGIVMPIAIQKENESKKNGEELPVSATKMASNMFQAMLQKYAKFNHEEKLSFVRMAKQKYEELLNEVE